MATNANISHGMNVEQVKSLASQMQAKAADIQSIMNQLDSALASTGWVGPDATAFEGQWNSDYKIRLNTVIQGLNDAATAANNNASQQESASM